MTKLTSVLLGLALAAMGILGITGLMPMFQTNPIYVNIGEIVLGALGMIVGIYSHKNDNHGREAKELSRQTKENSSRQRQENDQLRKQNEQQRKQNDQQREENEQLKKNNG